MKSPKELRRPESGNWILIRGARQLLTLHGPTSPRRGAHLSDLRVIVDGSVLIRDGIIEAVGPTRRIENLAAARHADVIDASARIVMPAFVDPCAVLVPVPGRSPSEGSKCVLSLPASRLEAEANYLLKLMARHGAATVAALSGFGCDAAGELKILRVQHALAGKPLNVVSVFLANAIGLPLDAQLDLLDCVARRKLAAIVSVRAGEGAADPETTASLLDAARSHGLRTRVEMLPGRRPELSEAAVDRGALSLSASGPYSIPEIELLSHAPTAAIVLPSARQNHGSARTLIDNGALVALASGLDPRTPTTASAQTVIQLACRHLDLSIAEAISAATINAACSLGIDSQTGTLEHGKQADIILLNASDYREIPLLAGTNLVSMMIKRGVILFKEEFPGWPSRS